MFSKNDKGYLMRLNGQLMYAHRYIVNQILGKTLEGKHPIHHGDLNCYHNYNNNLVVCEDTEYHNLLHLRTEAYRAVGNPHARRCALCKKWDTLDNSDFKIYYLKGNPGGHGRHMSCQVIYNKKRVGDEDFTPLKPGSASWMKFWRENPHRQEEMLIWKRSKER